MKPPSDMTATVETGIDETILSRVGLASINTHGKVGCNQRSLLLTQHFSEYSQPVAKLLLWSKEDQD
jgi:hypothetical protein